MTRRVDHDLESRLERAMRTPTEEAMCELVRERDLRLRDIQRAGYKPERHSPTWWRCIYCGELVEPGKTCQTRGCADHNDSRCEQQREDEDGNE